jgi:hypothetical protein
VFIVYISYFSVTAVPGCLRFYPYFEAVSALLNCGMLYALLSSGD